MVLTVSFVISPVIGLFCHRHRRDAEHCRQLGISVEMPEPHDFAVRLQVRSSFALEASTASRLASVTIASRPSVRRDDVALLLFLPGGQAKNFFERDWTAQISLNWLSKLDFTCTRGLRAAAPGQTTRPDSSIDDRSWGKADNGWLVLLDRSKMTRFGPKALRFSALHKLSFT